jgi:hypothetical protein
LHAYEQQAGRQQVDSMTPSIETARSFQIFYTATQQCLAAKSPLVRLVKQSPIGAAPHNAHVQHHAGFH